jgi:hypothetical protein
MLRKLPNGDGIRTDQITHIFLDVTAAQPTVDLEDAQLMLETQHCGRSPK